MKFVSGNTYNNTRTCKGGCCCDHAHIHAVPLEIDIKDEFRNFGFTLRKIDNLEELTQQKDRKWSK